MLSTKRGQSAMSPLAGVAIALVIVGVTFGLGGLVLSQTRNTALATNQTGIADTAATLMDGISMMGDWLSPVVIAAGAAAVVTAFLSSLPGRKSRRMEIPKGEERFREPDERNVFRGEQ